MALRVVVVRHSVRETPDNFAEAEEGDPEAELTPEGEQIAEAIGKWMAENEAIPEKLFVSPTVRSSQTAERIANAIEAEGFARPESVIDSGIGPNQSIRGTIQKAASDKSHKTIGIVSHRGSIVTGLKALNIDNGDKGKVDDPAMGEARVLKVKRKNARWKEERRARPSDLLGGYPDTY